MKIIDLVQGSTEWKEFRRFRIGASMAATILGINPWETQLQLWENIINGNEKIATEAMQRGSQMESLALKDFNNSIQNKEDKPMVPTVVQSDDYDWLIASLDGFDGTLSVEIKCGEATYEEAIRGKIPDYYFAQLQHQMMVLNTNSCHYYAFDGKVGIPFVVERDDAYCEKLLKAEREFYQSLLDFNPPKESEKDRMEITDQELVEKTNNLTKLQAIIDQSQAEYDEIKAQILSKITHPRVKIGKMNISKVIRKGAVQYDKIEVLKGLNLDEYRKKSIETWRVTINES